MSAAASALVARLAPPHATDGLFVEMQPIMSLRKPHDALDFEVLLRMRKPNGEIVPAPVIIEAAEAHGKSSIIDTWVVTTVIAWLEAHAAQLANTQFVGVNLSGSSLNDEAFVEDLFRLFERHKAAVARICIEITETVALTDMAHMQRFIDRVRSAQREEQRLRLVTSAPEPDDVAVVPASGWRTVPRSSPPSAARTSTRPSRASSPRATADSPACARTSTASTPTTSSCRRRAPANAASRARSRFCAAISPPRARS